jgi:hypothetical protein
MTRRTDPIFEVFDAEDAFRTTPSEEFRVGPAALLAPDDDLVWQPRARVELY